MKFTKNKYFYISLIFISLYSLLNIFVAFSFGELLNMVDIKNYSEFKISLVKSLLVILLVAATFYFKEFFKRKYTASKIYELSSKVFSSIIQNKDKVNSGDTISFLTNDINMAISSKINFTYILIENLILLIFAIVALFKLRVSLSFAVIISSIILVNFPKLFKGFLSKYRKFQVDNLSKFNNFIANSLEGFDTIKDFSAEKTFIDDVNKISRAFEKSAVNSTVSINLVNNIQFGISFLIQLLIILFAGVLIYLGHLEIGSILIVGQLLSFITDPIEQIMYAKNEVSANDSIFKNIEAIEKDDNDKGTLIKENLEEKIELNDINLNFESKKVFDGLNLEIEKGKKYALMGKSGAGKSTLFKLIKGDLKADSGNILIDGINIGDLSKESKRNIFQSISQDSFMFNDTIKKNIFLYDDFSEDKYKDSLKKVNMYDTINNLEEKDLTIIDGKSHDLSGGQKQRIQIARALMRDKDVFLFDEVTANLDEDNAQLIEETIKNMNKTIIAIRHRVDDSLKNYDYIIYLDSGKANLMDYRSFIENFK